MKIYKYRIRNSNFKKWKELNEAARKIYRKYGGGNSEFLIKKEGDLISVTELDYYTSRGDFQKTIRRVNRDPMINLLFSEFLRVVHLKKIIEDECETV